MRLPTWQHGVEEQVYRVSSRGVVFEEDKIFRLENQAYC